MTIRILIAPVDRFRDDASEVEVADGGTLSTSWCTAFSVADHVDAALKEVNLKLSEGRLKTLGDKPSDKNDKNHTKCPGPH